MSTTDNKLENAHNCVMDINGTRRHFTLTEEALNEIEGFRSFIEMLGGNHQAFFMKMMSSYHELLMEKEAPDLEKKFEDCFSDASYFCHVLTSIARTK